MRTAAATAALALAAAAAPALAFVPVGGRSYAAAAAVRTCSSSSSHTALRMVEKVEVDVVSPGPKKAALDAQTTEFVNSAKEVADSLKRSLSDLNAESIQDDLQAAVEGAKNNIKQGELGQRGELLAIVPYLVLAFLLAGDLPFLGGPLELLAGPGLLLGGALLVLAGVVSLGKNLSPWPQPCEGNVLKTSGVYSLCRHPTYAGLIAFGFGLGFATDSFSRIALAGLLWYVLDTKATKEEEALIAIHPAYKTYQEEVSKFWPLPVALPFKIQEK